MFEHEIVLAVDTLYIHLDVTLEHVCEQFLCIPYKEMCCLDRWKGTHNATDNDGVMTSLDHHF